jgi:hypothetical protein
MKRRDHDTILVPHDATLGHKKVRLSRHARRQMKWRNITEKEIRDTLGDPDRLEDSIKDRKNAFKTVGNRRLKITYKLENDAILIVTTMAKGERT